MDHARILANSFMDNLCFFKIKGAQLPSSKTYRIMIALMLVLFIDGMGQGLIFPILTSTITNVHATVILQITSEHLRDIWYGILIAAYFLM